MKLALVCATATLLLADPLSDTFTKMDAAAKKFSGLTASLQQTVYNALAKDTSTASGDIKLKKVKGGPTRWLVNFTQPDPKVAALDGNSARIYYPKLNVENVYDISTKKDMVEQVMLLGFGATSEELQANYDITFMGAEPINGQPATHIKLVPKSKDMLRNFRQVDLWISNTLGIPLQQKFLTSTSGDYTQFTYSDLKLTSSLSDKDLQLKPAKGVQIKVVGK
jgi:outer membrane lipoprotein-sorting protein